MYYKKCYDAVEDMNEKYNVLKESMLRELAEDIQDMSPKSIAAVQALANYTDSAMRFMMKQADHMDQMSEQLDRIEKYLQKMN